MGLAGALKQETGSSTQHAKGTTAASTQDDLISNRPDVLYSHCLQVMYIPTIAVLGTCLALGIVVSL
jgi:hypothetical protein